MVCEHPFALHRKQPKKGKENGNVSTLEKFLRTLITFTDIVGNE